MGTFIRHEPCPSCGSRDNLARYENGSATCWGCGHWEPPVDGFEMEEIERRPTSMIDGHFEAIPNRKLKEDICKKYGYQVGTYKGAPVHIANYHDPETRKIVAQKIRSKDKKFTLVGDGKNLPLFGQHLWNGDKTVIITEGEIDCLSLASVLKWPVVSLPNGASSVEKSIKKAYEWLSRYDEIVLCFDNDEAGQKATEIACGLLPAGKVHVMTLPRKDANEVLVNDGPDVLVTAFFNKKEWRPDGIRTVEELRQEVLNPVIIPSVPYPFSGLNERLGGLRQGELVTITSGSGLGKSTLVRELVMHLLNQGESVGVMALEESNSRTLLGLMSIDLSKNLVTNRDQATPEEIEQSFDKIAKMPLYLWDHFGSNEIESVLSKVRFMVTVLGCKWIIVDHLSILISGLEVTDERKTIDLAMTKLRTLVSELGCGMLLVSHLKRPEGNRGHEDGAEVHLGQLRGSHSIAQLSDAVIGLQKSADDPFADIIEPVVLKNRFSGNKGSCGVLTYDRNTGRLAEAHF